MEHELALGLVPLRLSEQREIRGGNVVQGLAIAAFWGRCASVGYRLGREAADAIWG